MKYQDGRFKGVRGVDIYYQSWLPEGEVKAVLLIVHGLGEHSGRYMNVVNHFVHYGYAVYGLDHPGHGKSGGHREMVKVFSDYTETLDIFLKKVMEWQKEIPIFMVAHSMGALIGLIYLTKNQSYFKGVIISGPPVKIPENVSKAAIFVGKILSRILPRLGIIGVDAEGISRDPKVVDAYLKDPLVFKGKTPARLVAEMLKAMTDLETTISGIELPILIIQGGADWIVDPTGAKDVFDKISSSDKSLEYYDDYYHEIFNDIRYKTPLKNIRIWLEKRLET